MKELVKKFYIEKYPDDELGVEIRDDITFEDVYNKLKAGEGEDIYDFIGVWDSLVRERIFGELSERLDVDYDVIYDLWLGRKTECYKESFEYLSDEDQKKEAIDILSNSVSFDSVKSGEEDISYIKDQLQNLMAEGHIEADAYKYIMDHFDELTREFMITEDVEIEKEENLRSLTDFINDGDFHTIVTDDARTFNVHEWEKRVEADDDSETSDWNPKNNPYRGSIEEGREGFKGSISEVEELPDFKKQRTKLGLSDADIDRAKEDILKNPNAGDVIQGSHGARKLRVSIESQNKGKSGGARVAYFNFYTADKSYLISILLKKDRDNFTDAEIEEIAETVDIIKKR